MVSKLHLTVILLFLIQAKIKKARHEMSTFMVSMDDLKDVDFYPILDLLKEIDASEIDAVNMVNRSSCVLSGEYVSSLLHAVNKKLRVVDICDISFGKDFLLYVVLPFNSVPVYFILQIVLQMDCHSSAVVLVLVSFLLEKSRFLFGEIS